MGEAAEIDVIDKVAEGVAMRSVGVAVGSMGKTETEVAGVETDTADEAETVGVSNNGEVEILADLEGVRATDKHRMTASAGVGGAGTEDKLEMTEESA
jgi:hypothetical protein